MKTMIDFIFDKLPYLVDFRSSELVCSNVICDFAKTDFGNFFINYFVIFNILYFGTRYFRKIFRFFR